MEGLDAQLSELKGKQEELGSQWNAEKDQMRSLQDIKEEIDRVNIEIQGAERDYDLNRAAELKYGTLLELQNKLNDTEKALESQVSFLISITCCFCGQCGFLVGCIAFAQRLLLASKLLCPKVIRDLGFSLSVFLVYIHQSHHHLRGRWLRCHLSLKG